MKAAFQSATTFLMFLVGETMTIFYISFLCFLGVVVAEELRIIQGGKEIKREIESPSILQTAMKIQEDIWSPRIVNGTVVQQEGKYPWQVSLEVHTPIGIFHICGGSLIGDDLVLTAAHCVETNIGRHRKYFVHAGIIRRNEENGQRIEVDRIYRHENYSGISPGYPNDIAVLRMKQKFKITKYVKHVSLPSNKNEDFEEADCLISGWGTTSGASRDVTNELREAKIRNINNTACMDKWTGINGARIFDSHICIFDGTASSCRGDSGGPYVCKQDNKNFKLAGVTSWGINTCSGSYPSVYTRVSYFLDWINRFRQQ